MKLILGVHEMNQFTKFAATAAAVLTFSAAAASADAAVYLGFEQNGGGITTVDVDASAVVFAGGFGNFELNIASGTDGVYPQLLGSQLQTANRAGGDAGVLDVYVTVTDLSQIPQGFFSSFAVNVLPTGWTVKSQTFADDGNGLYGGTLLSTNTFNGIGTYTDISQANLSGLYSVTARYTITAPTNGEALTNAAIAAVPEPGTWALMIAGFGGAGAMLRRRRAVFA
jgi:hypothetical protein